VIVVIGVLASLVGPMVFGHVGEAKVSAARAQIEIFGLALDVYRMDNDYYPSTGQGLSALVAQPTGDPPARRWRGPYLKGGVPMDPWGQPYQYRSPADSAATQYEIRSLGRDGRPGGTGEDADISPRGQEAS
jgi:general secretion pathway protein G